MRFDRLLAIVGATAALLLSGCSATGDMKALLERGEFEQASDWYLGRQAELQKDSDAPPLVERAVQGLAIKLSDRSSALSARLGAVSFRVGPEQWGLIRADLSESRQLLDRYSRFSALRSGGPLTRELQTLREATRQAEDTLRRSAPEQFARYDHQGNFFQEFPLSLAESEQQEVLARGFPGLLRALQAASGAATLRIVEAYAAVVTGAERQGQFLAAYENSIIRERGWKEPLDFVQTLALIEQVKDSPLASFKSTRPVVAIEITQACSDHKIEWELDQLAIASRQIVLDALPETLRTLKSEGVRHVAVAVPDCIAVTESVLRVDKRKAKKIGAMRTVPNPAYPKAVEAVNEASSALSNARVAAKAAQAAKDAYRRNRSSGNPWANLLTDLVVDGGSAIAVGSYEADLAQKQAILQAMPTTVQVPVFHYYQVPVVVYERARRHQVNVYVADLSSDKVQHFRLDDRMAVTANETLDIDASDPDRTVVAVENERRRDILDTVDQQPLALVASRTFTELGQKTASRSGETVARLPELIRGNIEQWKKGGDSDQQKAMLTVAGLGTQLGALRSRVASEGFQGEAPDGKPTRAAAATVPAIGVATTQARVQRRNDATPAAAAVSAAAPIATRAVPAEPAAAAVVAPASRPETTPAPTPPSPPKPVQRIYPTW